MDGSSVDVDRALWQGRVPVAFTVLRSELPADAPHVDPFYVRVCVGRVSVCA